MSVPPPAEHAFAWTAVFVAETLADRVGAAPFKLAHSVSTMLGADATCLRKSGAACLLAHFLVAPAVLAAPASSFDSSGAVVERAGPKCAMCAAKPSC